ncbi:YjbH domain-containing protein [Sulfitobacter sp.]|uniref:YjbH domain-containing protein n=1 Tax=Sulfitobacter sp. TaxID=1903071 RepID=UPI003F6C29F1
MQGRTRKIASVLAVAGVGALSGPQSSAQSLSTYGTPGLIEMPTAEVLSDGEFGFTASVVGPSYRYTSVFQVFPRVYGTFRYSIVSGLSAGGPNGGNLYDRSFDLHYQISDESGYRPAFAVGLRDFLGTGLYSSEYFVATKSFGSKIEVTGGLGWGRLAGRGSFSNPLGILSDRFDTRDVGTTGLGGQLETGKWFRGETSVFAGVKWHVSDQTTLFAEYSPDVYTRESVNTGIDISTPLNVGLEYRFKNGVNLKGYVVGGNEIGAQLSYVFNPAERRYPGGLEGAPRSVGARNKLAIADWNNSAKGGGQDAVRRVLKASLAEEGLALQGFTMGDRQATIRIENNRFDIEAQAAGRAARVMAMTLPPQIEKLTVVFQRRGVPLSRVVTMRSDLEELQFDYDGAWRTLARAKIEDAHDQGRAGELDDYFPEFDASFGPYLATSFFDPDSPIRADLGAQLRMSYRPSPGLTFSGQLRYPLIGNIADSDRVSDSKIEPVRTNAVRYAQESDLELNTLTAEYMFRPGKDLFGRVSAGYLESNFGGVSAEVLWYPVASRLALGGEINYVKQRDFDMLLGFQDYDVLTGHASAYYDFGNGFFGQLDVGRYLAGDYGATVSIDREFNNGFKVGGFFTLTDVPFDDFGEGSFDKGLKVEIPLSWFTGRPSRRYLTQTIRPIVRDGGARLAVANRLHSVVREYRGKDMRDGWAGYLR